MYKKIIILSLGFIMMPFFLTAQSLEEYFQSELDSLYQKNKDAVGVLLHVESPDRNISFTTAIGFSDKKKEIFLDKNQPVLIASNTKPYVAAAILRLIEKNNIELNQSIKKLISRKLKRKFSKDGYELDKITLRHLLSHTSGIADYVDEFYFDFVNDNPNYHWKKEEQIARSLEIGDPLFEVGSKFQYGDINYLLLTEIIARQTKQPFYSAIKQLLKFDELGLQFTWFKDLEPFPNNTLPIAHQYAEKHNWDSYELNPSWDLYGGGGLASTVKDAALFFQYLFEAKIIEDPAVLKEMHQYVLPKDQSNYCLGIRNISFPTFTTFYHGGWWGTDVAYCPETNSSIAIFTLEKSKRGEFAKLSISFMKKLAEE